MIHFDALHIVLALLSLALFLRCRWLSRDVNFGIFTASYGMRWLAQDRRRKSLIFLDLDNFKAFNQQHGHSEADRRVRAALRFRYSDHATAIKRGGDEIIVACPVGLESQLVAVIRARLAAQGLTATICVVCDVHQLCPALVAVEQYVLTAKACNDKDSVAYLDLSE